MRILCLLKFVKIVCFEFEALCFRNVMYLNCNTTHWSLVLVHCYRSTIILSSFCIVPQI